MERTGISCVRSLAQRFITWAGFDHNRCALCARLMTGKPPLCQDCSSKLPLRDSGYCPHCGELFSGQTSLVHACPACLHHQKPWDNFYFYNAYSGPLRELILDFKFRSGLKQRQLLNDLVWQTFEKKASLIPDVILPVPLHTERLAWRGYNQSNELCRTIGEKLDRPVLPNTLKRIRKTQPQMTLGAHERKRNVANAFHISPQYIKGKRVLLIDDVYTTGSTLHECTKTVHLAGALAVDVLVLARAV